MRRTLYTAGNNPKTDHCVLLRVRVGGCHCGEWVQVMVLETKRLRLRRLQPSDAVDLFSIVGDPQVMRYWAPGPDESVLQTATRIDDINEHWDVHGFGDWGVVHKENQRLIGFSGLHYIEGMTEVNVGYALSRNSWQKGLGAETCRVVFEYAFKQLKLPEVVAVIAPENTRSIHLAQKSGLQFWKNITWTGHERVVYRIRRGDFERYP